MSLGINLLMYLTEIASKSLGDNFLSKVFEVHHKHKKDYPSGTALMLGKGIANGKNKNLYNLIKAKKSIVIDRDIIQAIYTVLKAARVVNATKEQQLELFTKYKRSNRVLYSGNAPIGNRTNVSRTDTTFTSYYKDIIAYLKIQRKEYQNLM